VVNALVPQDTEIGAAETFLLLQLFQLCTVWQKRKVRKQQGYNRAMMNSRCMAKNVVEAQGGGTEKSGHWCEVIFCTMG